MDRQYLGWRKHRLQGEEYLSFIGRFVRAFRNVFPDAICQWENFLPQNGFGIRDAFADEIISFNDNIQSTGSVALAAVISAMRNKKEKLADQKFLVLGDDSECLGICEQLYLFMEEEGVECQEARDRVFIADRNGIITTDRADAYYVRPFAKDPERFPELCLDQKQSIPTFIKKAGITVYASTFEGEGCIDKQVVSAMLSNSARPVILPLHPATDMTDACVKSIYDWSNGKALVASGSPRKEYSTSGVEWRVSQANNILVFPGIALGVLASGTREIIPKFFTVAARTVAGMVPRTDLDNGQLLPSLQDLEKISNKVALAVAMCSVEEGLSRPCVYSTFQHENDESRMRELIKKMRWFPDYLPLVAM